VVGVLSVCAVIAAAATCAQGTRSVADWVLFGEDDEDYGEVFAQYEVRVR
jgi:hypothetical protein